MPVSLNLGGVPELTAVFVMFAGVFGTMLGGVLLKWLPLRGARYLAWVPRCQPCP